MQFKHYHCQPHKGSLHKKNVQVRKSAQPAWDPSLQLVIIYINCMFEIWEKTFPPPTHTIFPEHSLRNFFAGLPPLVWHFSLFFKGFLKYLSYCSFLTHSIAVATTTRSKYLYLWGIHNLLLMQMSGRVFDMF